MKKLFSAVIATAMIASTFVANVFAESTLDFALSNNRNGKEIEAGTTVNITVTLTGAEFNCYAMSIGYDSSAFEYVKTDKATSSNLDAKPNGKANVDENDPTASFVATNYATSYDEKYVVEVEDEETGDTTEVAAKNTYYVQFKVKNGAVTGSYPFTLIQTADQAMGCGNQDGDTLVCTLGDATNVSVKGVDPAPSYTAATCDIKYTDVDEAAVYTKGIKGTITPNDDAVKGVSFTLKNTANEKTKLVDWTFDAEKIAGKSPIVFGLNVLNVPAGVDVTIDGDVTIAK